MKGHKTSRYVQVRTSTSHFYVHREVAKAFCDSFNEDLVINHKDGNKQNNHKENLECISQKDNIIHAYNKNLNLRRIPIEKCDFTGKVIKKYASFMEAGKDSGFSDGCIRWNIKYNDGKLGGFIWRRARNEINVILHSNEIEKNTCNEIDIMKLHKTAIETYSNASKRVKFVPDELKEIGINELPRYLFWNKLEQKFVIEKHPKLIKDVKNGKRKTCRLSCMKGKRELVTKYKDALSKLLELNE